MTPTAYLNEIVFPTAREFLQQRGERRLACVSCITAFHVCDYLQRSESLRLDEVRARIRALCAPSFDVVDGICNGTKHCGRNRGAYQHQPGSERAVAAFAFDMPGAGWGEGRWEVPGLEIEHDGQKLFVDWCLQVFLLGVVRAFPAHFGGCDMSWIDNTLTAGWT